MENTATIIESIATLLWPLIVIAILILFRKNVQGLIESARGRKFTVKIGEMELSMDELSKQQGDMIKDLQTRVNELQRQIDPKSKAEIREAATAAPPQAEESRTPEDALETLSEHENADDIIESDEFDDDISDILWVDDHPKNNALLIDTLAKSDISVSVAENTSEALEHFKLGSFDCVISDTCRKEGGEVPNCHAGFELASRVREMDREVPIYIYTDNVDEKMKKKASMVGATAITSSPSELLKLLRD